MHPEDFRHFYEKVKSRPFKDDQIEMMRTVARNNSLNCVQCASLMALYTFDDDKMKVLNIFAPNIVDPENYEAILDVIDSLFKKDDAKKILAYAIKKQACRNALSVGAKHMMYRRLTDNAFKVNR